MSEILFCEIDAARELTGGSVYKLRQLREAGILDAPITIDGVRHPRYTFEQLRTCRRRIERLAYQPTETIKPITLRDGESFV